ncbi:hypothetical protein T09_3337 [Trichinella sp. T9]|nr:hypothetical protein T09_3337 [Trichinella sp. T9]
MSYHQQRCVCLFDLRGKSSSIVKCSLIYYAWRQIVTTLLKNVNSGKKCLKYIRRCVLPK